MNPQNENDREKELHAREKELQDREHALRLRELEAEIHNKYSDRDAPYHQTQKYEPEEGSLQRGWKKLVKWAKFIGFVIVGIGVVWVGVQVGMFLTYALIASVVGFIGYKIFLEKDSSK
jgi:hypothetical protein